MALVAPALVLTSPSPVGVTTTSHEDGARRMPSKRRVPEPADATR